MKLNDWNIRNILHLKCYKPKLIKLKKEAYDSLEKLILIINLWIYIKRCEVKKRNENLESYFLYSIY
jgi:hypothetical protein